MTSAIDYSLVQGHVLTPNKAVTCLTRQVHQLAFSETSILLLQPENAKKHLEQCDSCLPT